MEAGTFLVMLRQSIPFSRLLRADRLGVCFLSCHCADQPATRLWFSNNICPIMKDDPAREVDVAFWKRAIFPQRSSKKRKAENQAKGYAYFKTEICQTALPGGSPGLFVF